MPTEGGISGPQRVPLPLGGIANASAYREQPQRFVPAQTCRNIRPYDTGADRPRLGTTPGIVKLLAQQFGGGAPFQFLDTVARSSVVAGHQLGETTPITGRSNLAGTLTGFQTFGLQPGSGGTVPMLEWMAAIDVTGEGGPASVAVVAAGRHPDTDMVVVATAAYTNGSDPNDVCRVVSYDRYGTQRWSVKISDASVDVFINTVAMGRLYTVITSNEKVIVLRNDTGAVAATSDLNDWSSEAIEARIWRDGTAEYVFVAFNGATVANGAMPNGGTVTAGFYAKCFRAGVMKFRLASDTYAQTPVLAQVEWGNRLASTETYFEAAHGYFRISENSALKPRGAVITAMAIAPNGDILLARCNCGGGPTNAHTPSLLLVRPITVCRISAAGQMLWEVDTDSIVRAAGAEAVPNDIPTGAGVEPSIQAIAAGNAGVYVGGAANAAAASAFGLSTNGTLQWAVTLVGSGGPPNPSIRQACIAIDPGDGNVLIGGDRSTAYSGGGSPNASFWKLSAQTGTVMWAHDLGNVSTLGVCCFANGRMVIVADEVP